MSLLKKALNSLKITFGKSSSEIRVNNFINYISSNYGRRHLNELLCIVEEWEKEDYRKDISNKLYPQDDAHFI